MTKTKIQIHLTDRSPVTIDPAKWPVIAQAKGWEGQYDFQANRSWWLKVRKHADQRALVYGVYDTQWQGESNLGAGYLVEARESGNEQAIIEAIRTVAEEIGHPEMARRCIQDLPSEEI